MSLGDSYKLDSYKKKSVYTHTPHLALHYSCDIRSSDEGRVLLEDQITLLSYNGPTICEVGCHPNVCVVLRVITTRGVTNVQI